MHSTIGSRREAFAREWSDRTPFTVSLTPEDGSQGFQSHTKLTNLATNGKEDEHGGQRHFVINLVSLSHSYHQPLVALHSAIKMRYRDILRGPRERPTEIVS